MACESRKAALQRHVDGESPPEEERDLIDHVENCPSCGEAHRRLVMEREALRQAMSGESFEAESRRRSPLKLAEIAAVLLVLLVIGLDRLLKVYSDAGSKLADARNQEQFEEIYGRTLAVRADGVPLEEFLTMVTDATGVTVELEECALRRMGDEPEVHLVLLRPIRLGSIVHLLEDFYDLRAEVREGAVWLG